MNYEYPLLEGQRVILNPESGDYHDLAGHIGDVAGHVVGSGFDVDDLMMWKARGASEDSSMSGATVNVMFDNGYRKGVKYRDLLLVEGKDVDTAKYHFRGGRDERLIIGAKKSLELLDKKIIVDGAKIRSILYFKDSYREKLIEHIKSSTIGTPWGDEQSKLYNELTTSVTPSS